MDDLKDNVKKKEDISRMKMHVRGENNKNIFLLSDVYRDNDSKLIPLRSKIQNVVDRDKLSDEQMSYIINSEIGDFLKIENFLQKI